MDKETAIAQGLELIKGSKIAMLGTNSEDGYPLIKAMLNLYNDGLKTILFSTNTSSKRVKQIQNDSRATVYYVDENNFKGLLLIGKIEVTRDFESRKKLWFDGCEQYYPQGIDDPDYSVLKFTVKKANYYHGLTNITFDIE